MQSLFTKDKHADGMHDQKKVILDFFAHNNVIVVLIMFSEAQVLHFGRVLRKTLFILMFYI